MKKNILILLIYLFIIDFCFINNAGSESNNGGDWLSEEEQKELFYDLYENNPELLPFFFEVPEDSSRRRGVNPIIIRINNFRFGEMADSEKPIVVKETKNIKLPETDEDKTFFGYNFGYSVSLLPTTLKTVLTLPGKPQRQLPNYNPETNSITLEEELNNFNGHIGHKWFFSKDDLPGEYRIDIYIGGLGDPLLLKRVFFEASTREEISNIEASNRKADERHLKDELPKIIGLEKDLTNKGIGVSCDEVLNIISKYFMAKKPVTRQQMYVGHTSDDSVVLLLYGDKQNISKATLSIALVNPKEEPDIVARNALIYGVFIKNIFLDEGENILDWVTSTIKKLPDSSQNHEERVVGNKRIIIQYIEEFLTIMIHVERALRVTKDSEVNEKIRANTPNISEWYAKGYKEGYWGGDLDERSRIDESEYGSDPEEAWTQMTQMSFFGRPYHHLYEQMPIEIRDKCYEAFKEGWFEGYKDGWYKHPKKYNSH